MISCSKGPYLGRSDVPHHGQQYRTGVFSERVVVHSSSHEDLHGVPRPELDALLDAAGATASEEERQKLVKEVDMYTMENHWWIWGPGAQQTRALQPWVVGYNGESFLGFMDFGAIHARLWIDSALKAEMGY